MNKSEELRKFIEELPANKVEWLVELFMESAKEYLKGNADAKQISGLEFNYNQCNRFFDFETLRECTKVDDDNWHFQDKRIPFSEDVLKHDCEPYHFAKALTEEGFNVYLIANNGVLSQFEVYF